MDGRINEIEKRLRSEFPDEAEMVLPRGASVDEARELIRGDEALVIFETFEDATYYWVITRDDASWGRVRVSSAMLAKDVAALRCGLDASTWEGDGAAKCGILLRVAAPAGSVPPPFDVPRAHVLYKTLFSDVEDLIRDKHLLIVPSGPLTQLPFHVLVTAGSSTDYRAAAWLARQNAVTVLPAVTSLKALRRVAKPSGATKAMIGFGNPLLDGDPAERPWEDKWEPGGRGRQPAPSLHNLAS